MRLSYAIELIVAVAVGLALQRTTFSRHQFDNMFRTYPRIIQYGVYLTDFGDPLCTGFILVEGVSIGIETIRRRNPSVWGFGRLTWSVCFFVVMLGSLADIVLKVAIQAIFDWPLTLEEIFRTWWKMFTSSEAHLITRTTLPLCMLGLLMTSLAARWPRDPCPDAREWAGRILFGAMMILCLIHKVLGCY